jgi:hypothetical protein
VQTAQFVYVLPGHAPSLKQSLKEKLSTELLPIRAVRVKTPFFARLCPMNKPKVLVDLCMAHSKLGFSGIPQDSRLLFDGLIQSPNINADGLLWSLQGSWMQRPPVSLLEQSVFLTINLKASSRGVIATRLSRVNPYLGNIWSRMFADNAKSYPVIPLGEPLNEIVWRTHFALTLRADRRTSPS